MQWKSTSSFAEGCILSLRTQLDYPFIMSVICCLLGTSCSEDNSAKEYELLIVKQN